MLKYDRATNEISEDIFKNLRNHLFPGDVLVINKTRVIPARIFGKKISGGKVEVLLLKKLDDLSWEVLIGGKNVNEGTEILFEDDLSGEITSVLFRGREFLNSQNK